MFLLATAITNFFCATIPLDQMLCSAVKLWTHSSPVCVSSLAFSSLRFHDLRTAMAACQPLI